MTRAPVAPALADHFTFDGREIPFEDDDTLASAMHRAGIRTLSRSMKYHRPRGAYCFNGGCAGCLVAVDGRPNILACLETATPCDVTSQNHMGTVKRDLLGVTDKVYRRGFDPHGAFTRPRLLNKVFLKAVRFMSGVGKVPETATGSRRRHTLTVDEIIIGGGAAGQARAAATRGKDVLLVHEGPHTEAPDHVQVWTGALAFGIYDDVVAVRRGGDLWEVTARRVTLATGDHDGWPLFPGNDLPGIMSMRAAWRLLGRHNVLPGRRVVVDGDPADLHGDLQRLGGGVVAHGKVSEVKGGTCVEKARIGGQWFDCDAVVCDVRSTPRIELAQQAGCQLRFQDGVLAPVVDAKGQTTRTGIHWMGGSHA